MLVTTPVDPRSTSAEEYQAVFEVRDWYSADGTGYPGAEVTAELSQASIWEVLEWAGQPREPRPVAAYVWAMHTCPDGERTRILLGVLEFVEGKQGAVHHVSLPEPDSAEGRAYFGRRFSAGY